MKIKKKAAWEDALDTISACLVASPDDKPKSLEGVKAAEKVLDDFIRAEKKKTRRLRDLARLIGSLNSRDRIIRKLGRDEVPIPKMI